jgi:hypothetical protein
MTRPLTVRLREWWLARKARRRRLERFQLVSSLPADIRSDIARGAMADAFDDKLGPVRRTH